MRTFLFTLFILAVVGGGLLYRFVGEIPGVTEKEPVFTPDEICELFSYDLDGRVGYLVEKGYKEKAHQDYETNWIFNQKFVLYPIGNTSKLALPILFDSNDDISYLVFNDGKKDEYLKFTNQFSEITTPLPKQGDQNIIQKICNLQIEIRAFGYMSDVNGYVILISKKNKDS